MCAQLGVKRMPQDFDHFSCYADHWLNHGMLLAHLEGDSPDGDWFLKPWYFIYDSDHDRFLSDVSESNKDVLVEKKKH
jgi:hypothetical protein